LILKNDSQSLVKPMAGQYDQFSQTTKHLSQSIALFNGEMINPQGNTGCNVMKPLNKITWDSFS